MPFRQLGLSENVLRGVQAAGYVDPTPIQLRGIPVIFAGKDLIGAAQTGTGKTAAFALPILTLLKSHGKCRCLVLEPTRELAAQVETAFRDYGRFTDLRTAVIFGGVGYGKQREDFKRGVDIMVATPGRLLDLMQQNTIQLRDISFLVLDEVDRMLDMGFLPDVRRIVERCPKQRQTLLFSATIPGEIERLASWVLRQPEQIEIGERRSPASTVTHAFYPVAANQKFHLLLALLERTEFNSVLIFSRTKHGADKIARRLQGGQSRRRGAAFQPHPTRTRGRAGGIQVGQVRGDGGDRHRRARHRRGRHHPRRQLRRAAASRGLRAPHRPHRPRARRSATRSR